MQAHDTRTIYEIPAENYAKFEERIAKLSKRSVRLGCEPIIPFVFDRFKRPVDAGKPEGNAYLVYKVLFTVDTPKLNGWRFVARIDHSNQTGNIVRPLPNCGVEIPTSFRSSKPFCQHCNVARYRRDTFIVCKDETNAFAQVGSTCLNDFLGHDAHKLARMAEWLGYADEAARGAEQFVGGDSRWVDVERYLAHAAWAVRRHGWTPRSAVPGEAHLSTASIAWTNCYPYSAADRAKAETPSDADRAHAEEALAWARTLREEAADRTLSEYEHNVSVIADALLIEDRSIGLAASIVGVYLRNKGKAAQAEVRRQSQRNSKHFGAVGDRVKALPCTMLNMFVFEGHYGPTYTYFFLTEDGNVVKWAASRGQDIVAGTKVLLSGAIKKHSTYKEVDQTEFTRCTITLVAEQKEAA